MFIHKPRPSITRVTLSQTLIPILSKLKPGKVLDVGAKNSPFLKYIPHTQYLRLDIRPDSKPDYVSDLHRLKIQNNRFDTVIATEVMEHLYNPQRAINEVYRILKPKGITVWSTRFIYKYHPDPHDYYRFTQDSLTYLFKKYKAVKIYPHGNRVTVIWQLLCSSGLGPILDLLTPFVAKINFSDPDFPLGFVVVARK